MFDWSYWAEKARNFRDDEKYYQAINCYEKLLENNSFDEFALTQIGVCYSDLGQFDKALIYVNKALNIESHDSFLWFNKGLVYFNNEDYTDAIKYFDKAISLKNDDYVSWNLKGWSYFYLNDIPNAIHCFETSYYYYSDEKTLNIIIELKKLNYDTTTKICPNCGRELNASAFNCGFCGYSLNGGNSVRSNNSSNSSKNVCPNCGRELNALAINCGFCGYSLSSADDIMSNNYYGISMKKCPNCGVTLNKNKKICPKCNYNFKKSKSDKPKINNPTGVKHFDNGIVSFDYPNNYVRDFNLNYEKIDILVSFKSGSNYNFDSAFAIFGGDSISDKIPDSKFKEVLIKSFDSDILNINRYFHGEKERIIIKTRNKINGNIKYYGNVPESGFYVLFILSDGNEHLFDENWVSTVVNSLDESTGEPIDDVSNVDSYIEESTVEYNNHVSAVENSLEKSTVESHVKNDNKICTNCGFENFHDSNFCMECGMKLDISDNVNFCIHCGTEIIHGSKFCFNCGKLIEY